MCVLVNWVKQWEPVEAEINTGEWRAFNAMDQHTPDVVLAQCDTGRKGWLKEEEDERGENRVGDERRELTETSQTKKMPQETGRHKREEDKDETWQREVRW